jgi:hypothetical protein
MLKPSLPARFIRTSTFEDPSLAAMGTKNGYPQAETFPLFDPCARIEVEYLDNRIVLVDSKVIRFLG